ncbi:MAG: hypothetical protein ACJ71Q_14070 [Terriglobales bacterium]
MFKNFRAAQALIILLITTFLLAAKGSYLDMQLMAEDSTAASKQAQTYGVRFMSFAEAAGVLRSLAAALPEELVHTVAANDSSEWDHYVRAKEGETRQRLRGGDLDTLANLLLFGTSYTTAPVLSPELLKNIHTASGQSDVKDVGSQALLLRLDQLTLGISHPGANERLKYFHDWLSTQHYQFETSQELFKVKQFLGANLVRMLREDASYAAALAEAQRLNDNGFEKRSQVFAHRGISLDTSLFPNYAIEEALAGAKTRGLLRSGVLRVGVIGPGLDVVNKDEGWDYYPEQTIQPFMLADSLVRLGLADAHKLEVLTFDISDLVNHHLTNARRRAAQGHTYVTQLPIRSDIAWNPAALRYWKRAGLAIGRAAVPLENRYPTALDYKAVAFPVTQVLHIHPIDLDIIYQRDAIPESGKLDLIIATNMFVYYGTFEQALAMSNISAMLRDEGLLLTNDALPEGPGLELRSVGSSEIAYSSRPHDGDRITLYRRAKLE